MKSQIKGSEFFVDSFVQNPVQIKADEFVSIGIGHGYVMALFHQINSSNLAALFQGNLKVKLMNECVFGGV